jgi:predicted DsbA family dithiol-disulfide isomerase
MAPDDRARTLETMTAAPITVEIWSDVVCPWCYIGKRRFERAVSQLAGEIEVDVVYRPYQLDPTASPGKSQPVFEAYSRKFGGPDRAKEIIDRVTVTAAEDGLGFRMDRAVRANTLLAHRLLWWAEQPTTPVAQEAVKERLLQAYFVDGLDVGDPEVLADLAAELGVDRDEARDFLDGDAGRAEVRSDLERAADHGISAVPTFVVNGQWAIPGAQDTETFVKVLRRLSEKLAAEAAAAADQGGACTDEACET